MIYTYNTAVTDIDSAIFGKERRTKNRMTTDFMDLCDERRDLKKRWYDEEGAKEYRKTNKRV